MIRILSSLLLALSFSSVSMAAYSRGWIEGEQASEVWGIFNTAKFLNKATQKGVLLISKVKKDAECEYKEVSGYQKNELSCGGTVNIKGLKAEQLKNSLQVAGLLEYTGSKSVANGRVTYLSLKWSTCEFGSVDDKKEDQYIDCR